MGNTNSTAGFPFFTAVAVMTLDGKIAKDQNDPVHWGSREDKLQLENFIRHQTDISIVGQTSYNLAKKFFLKFPDIPCAIVTRKIQNVLQINPMEWQINLENIDLRQWCREQGWKRITLLGGSQIYSWCLTHGMIDMLRLTIEPLVFGDGIGLFSPHLVSRSQAFPFSFILDRVEQINDRGTSLFQWRRTDDATGL